MRKKQNSKKKRLKKIKAEVGDNYAIKNQDEILQEPRVMIPDCQRKLEAT